MTDEEKKALEAEAKAKAEEKEAEFKASLDGLSDEEKESKLAEKEAELSKNNTGTEEALKKERAKREEAERKLAETRQKAKERFEKRKQEGSDEDEPITRESLRQFIDDERDNLRKEMRQERAVEVAREVSENEADAELTLEIWKNRTLSGSLEEQLREANAIATYQKTQAQLREAKRALASKGGVSEDGANSQRKPTSAGEPKLNPTDKQVVSGMTWDNAKKAYKKKIAGGRKMFYVSGDLSKRWTENA